MLALTVSFVLLILSILNVVVAQTNSTIPAAGSYCQSTVDCLNPYTSLYCSAGLCVKTKGQYQVCLESQECDSGLYCTNYICSALQVPTDPDQSSSPTGKLAPWLIAVIAVGAALASVAVCGFLWACTGRRSRSRKNPQMAPMFIVPPSPLVYGGMGMATRPPGPLVTGTPYNDYYRPQDVPMEAIVAPIDDDATKREQVEIEARRARQMANSGVDPLARVSKFVSDDYSDLSEPISSDRPDIDAGINGTSTAAAATTSAAGSSAPRQASSADVYSGLRGNHSNLDETAAAKSGKLKGPGQAKEQALPYGGGASKMPEPELVGYPQHGDANKPRTKPSRYRMQFEGDN